MTHIEKLDKMLEYISKNKYNVISNLELSHGLIPNFNYTEIEIRYITDKIANDGYIQKDFQEEKTIMRPYPDFLCSMTYEGFLFLERGGYESENKSIIRYKRYIKLKTIAVIANAVIIISIAFWGVKVQSDSNKKDEVNINIENRIENLSAKVDSLTTKQKLNNTTNNQAPSP